MNTLITLPNMTVEEATAKHQELKLLIARLKELEGDLIADMDFFDVMNKLETDQ
jgi:hypothetical protein